MSKKNKNWNELKRQENALTASIAAKLHAIFQTRYREYRKNNPKSKNKGGGDKDKTSHIKRTSQHSIAGLKYELRLQMVYYGIGTPHIPLKNQPILSPEQISMIDMDYDGAYFTPPHEDLSPTYRITKDYFLSGASPSHIYKISEYDF